MMVRFVRGNLFDSQASALVNTVNCVGIMGKGIAYEFRRAYPAYHDDYVLRCRRHEVQLGHVYSYRERNKTIVTFPTKQHWKSKSRLEDVEAGLAALRSLVQSEHLTAVAVPPVGCGNGGLAWSDVKPLVERHLGDLDGVDFEVYEPAGSFQSRVAKEPRVSLSHFLLVALRLGLTSGNKLNLQKAAYFFNVFSETDYFRFTEYKFGPYCIAIDPMVNTITDYLQYRNLPASEMVEDGLGRRLSGHDVDRLRQLLPVVDQVRAFCNRNIANLEALATAHAVVARSGAVPVTREQGVRLFLAWSEEKSQRFTEDRASAAFDALADEGLVTAGLFGYQLAEHIPRGQDVGGELVVPADISSRVRRHAALRGLTTEEVIREALQAFLGKSGAGRRP